MDYVQLVGGEQVQRAANTMQSSAELIQSSVSQLSDSLQRHEIFLSEWLINFEEVLKRKEKEDE